MSDVKAGPGTDFKSFGFQPAILRGIAAAGFTSPRPIQQQAMPACIEGRDILGLARTGTGKTAAFALPIVDRLLKQRAPGPRALIVAPTRELASQIAAETRLLAQFTKLKVITVFGGVSERPQIQQLRARPEIVVACPGRLLDLARNGYVTFERLETLVLDEADHMFDMGFLPDIRRILALLPEPRQNLLFSATMPREIRKLAMDLLDSPTTVDLTDGTPPPMIEHALYPLAEPHKRVVLDHLLGSPEFVSAIVFTRTKIRAKRLALHLNKIGHRAVALQGNMSQNARDRAMEGFRKRKVDVLVATDIVARGIDVEKVSHVVNYDMPNTVEAYTHRVGRTGRSGLEGKAYTFVTPADHEMVRDVERRIGKIPRRRVEGLELADAPVGESLDYRESRGGGRQRNGRRKTAAAGRSAGGRGAHGGRSEGESRGSGRSRGGGESRGSSSGRGGGGGAGGSGGSRRSGGPGGSKSATLRSLENDARGQSRSTRKSPAGVVSSGIEPSKRGRRGRPSKPSS